MKRILYLISVVSLMFTPAFSRQAASNDAAASREDIEKLFASLNIRNQMHQMMELSAKQSMQMAHDTLKKKVPELKQKDLERLDNLSDRIIKQFDVDGMLDDMIPVYERHLTKADVAAMTAFYESPTGRKMLKEQPEMMAEAMKAVQPRLEKMMSNVMEEAEKMVKEASAESTSSGGGTKTAK